MALPAHDQKVRYDSLNKIVILSMLAPALDYEDHESISAKRPCLLRLRVFLRSIRQHRRLRKIAKLYKRYNG